MSSNPATMNRWPSQTKIVATVGPACDGVEKLVELVAAGVDVFRVNTAHGDRAEHQRRVDEIREAADRAGRVVGILVDLPGPKIRLGSLPGGQLECVAGSHVQFVAPDAVAAPGQLTTTYPSLLDELQPGDRIVLADGTVMLAMEEKAKGAALCRVVQGGLVRSRQGVNLPGAKLSVPALGATDQQNARWAALAGVDFVGLSFVRSADDVRQLRTILQAEDAPTQVIAKIEKPEALENLEAIVEAADAVMIARGDLGVEIDIARVPVVQKEIILACRRRGRPVIVATQMLDSMQHSRIPTRAEATDVANAILDGADACMLSGETAIGRYPREAVETMHRIATATEPLYARRPRVEMLQQESGEISPITQATTRAAGRLAEQLDARLILVASATGRTALCVSSVRRPAPTIGVSDSKAVLRRMCLYWGVIPLADAPTHDGEALVKHVVQWGLAAGRLAAGDRVVLVAGTHIAATPHNMIVVHEVD